MMLFQLAALLLTATWLALVVHKFKRSTLILVIGLVFLGIFTVIGVILGLVTWADLGLGRQPWLLTLGYALAGLVVLLAWSPVADWFASRLYKQLPSLETFRAIQRSRWMLFAGILSAWLLGGILEELVARGIVLRTVEGLTSAWLGPLAASILAVMVAALGAGMMHLYQGPRAVVIIAQLSLLLGILFVVCGYNLWAVMLCHGFYDTIAFIRFGRKKSKYSRVEDPGISQD